jgi:hypothetical protein
MLLELENQITKRIHERVGQSAVVMRLAEELDESGNEQVMIVVAYSSDSSRNPNEGAYIPTVRSRRVSFSVTIVYKETQRVGHSFVLPLLDLIYDALAGWIPDLPGFQFQTGFENSSSSFAQINDASQFIYKQNWEITLLIRDGRFASIPGSYSNKIDVLSFLPKRRCLLAKNGRKVGWAWWEKTNPDGSKSNALVPDCDKCEPEIGDRFELTCIKDVGGVPNGQANYTYIPKEAITQLISEDGKKIEQIDQSMIQTGVMSDVWRCIKVNSPDYPDWCKLKVKSGLWRENIGQLPNSPTQDPINRLFGNLTFEAG